VEPPAALDLPSSRTFTEHEYRLVRATYRLMSEVGTQQLSLRRVAKEIDVSPALIVYHFGSRERLMLETMHWALAGTVRRIQRTVAGISDPEDALSALMDAVFVGAEENRDFHLVYMDLVQYSVREPSFTGLTEILREHINGSYAAIIGAGVRAKVFDVDDVELAARRARAIVEGEFLQWLQTDDWRDTHTALRDDCHETLLRLIRPTRRRSARER